VEEPFSPYVHDAELDLGPRINGLNCLREPFQPIIGDEGILEPAFFSSATTCSQNLAPSFSEIHIPRTSLVRNSLRYVSWRQRKVVAAVLKLICDFATAEQAEIELRPCSVTS